VPLTEGQAVQQAADVPEASQREEFLATLTPQEKRFFHDHLLAPATAVPPEPLSPANFRKLKQRVLAKLHRFLRHSDGETAV
jgi:hypothetical protein